MTIYGTQVCPGGSGGSEPFNSLGVFDCEILESFLLSIFASLLSDPHLDTANKIIAIQNMQPNKFSDSKDLYFFSVFTMSAPQEGHAFEEYEFRCPQSSHINSLFHFHISAGSFTPQDGQTLAVIET